MVLTLYKLDASPPVRAVLMTIEALNIKGIKYVDINLLEGEHLKEDYLMLNPQHTIPTLKDDEFVIWDSHAIACYLVQKYGNNDSLYPSEPQKRAVVDQRLYFDTGILFPVLRECVEPVIFKGQKQYNDGMSEKIKSAYNFINTFLTTPWLAGTDITLADICCVATVSSLNEVMPVDEDTHPRMADWLKACSEEDFYKNGNARGLEMFRGLLRSRLG